MKNKTKWAQSDIDKPPLRGSLGHSATAARPWKKQCFLFLVFGFFCVRPPGLTHDEAAFSFFQLKRILFLSRTDFDS